MVVGSFAFQPFNLFFPNFRNGMLTLTGAQPSLGATPGKTASFW